MDDAAVSFMCESFPHRHTNSIIFLLEASGYDIDRATSAISTLQYLHDGAIDIQSCVCGMIQHLPVFRHDVDGADDVIAECILDGTTNSLDIDRVLECMNTRFKSTQHFPRLESASNISALPASVSTSLIDHQAISLYKICSVDSCSAITDDLQVIDDVYRLFLMLACDGLTLKLSHLSCELIRKTSDSVSCISDVVVSILCNVSYDDVDVAMLTLTEYLPLMDISQDLLMSLICEHTTYVDVIRDMITIWNDSDCSVRGVSSQTDDPGYITVSCVIRRDQNMKKKSKNKLSNKDLSILAPQFHNKTLTASPLSPVSVKRAAQSNIDIFNGRSTVSDDDYSVSHLPRIDLHGARALEAVDTIHSRLSSYIHNKRDVIIITGKGIHSVGGVPVLLPTVMHYLDVRHIVYDVLDSHAGIVVRCR